MDWMIMLKLNMKLLLRQKAFILSLLIIPAVGIALLRLPDATGMFEETIENGNYAVQELESERSTSQSLSNTRLGIKVYDSDNTAFSKYFLNQLVQSGMYNIYRLASEPMTYTQVKELAVDSFNKNNLGAVLYLEKGFTESMMEGQSDDRQGIYLMKGADDQRISLLEDNIKIVAGSIVKFGKVSSGNILETEKLIQQIDQMSLKKKIVSIAVGDHVSLTAEQKSQSFNIGISLAIITLGFLFTGVFVASIVIDENQKGVMTRIKLTNISLGQYGLVKFILSMFTVLLQVGIVGIGVKLFVPMDFGVSFGSYLLFILGVGIVYNLLSVVIGTIVDNVMNAGFIAFFIWTIAGLLSGSYFPIEETTGLLKKVSLLMPQRWVVETSELLMAGEGSGAYMTYAMVILGFLAVILCGGYMGLKIRKKA